MSNLKCSHDDILLFWSGELPEEKKGPVLNHLERCAQCRVLISDLTGIQEQVKALPTVSSQSEIPDPFSQLKRREKRAFIPQMLPWMAPAIAAAAAAVLIFFAVPNYWGPGGDHRTLVAGKDNFCIQKDLADLRSRVSLFRRGMSALRPKLALKNDVPAGRSILKIRKRMMHFKAYSQCRMAVHT